MLKKMLNDTRVCLCVHLKLQAHLCAHTYGRRRAFQAEGKEGRSVQRAMRELRRW